jgi:hypothetical protein
MSQMGHERHFRDVREESGLPPIADVLWQRSEATFRARSSHPAADLTFRLFDRETERLPPVTRHRWLT